MEEVEALIAQTHLLHAGKTIRKELEETCKSTDALLEALQSTRRELVDARTRIADLETENAKLQAMVGPKALTSEQQTSLLSQLVALREVIALEQEDRRKIVAEFEGLKRVNAEMEQQLAQLSPTRLYKKGKTSKPAQAEESRSYKSLYQKRRQQSDAGSDTPRFS